MRPHEGANAVQSRQANVAAFAKLADEMLIAKSFDAEPRFAHIASDTEGFDIDQQRGHSLKMRVIYPPRKPRKSFL